MYTYSMTASFAVNSKTYSSANIAYGQNPTPGNSPYAWQGGNTSRTLPALDVDPCSFIYALLYSFVQVRTYGVKCKGLTQLMDRDSIR